jgi:hypothetical protein
MISTNSEQLFIEYRDAFCREIKRLVNTMKLYRHLHEKKSDRLEALNVAPAFFRCVLDSFFTTIILGADKLLTEKRSGEFSVPILLSFIEKNINMFSVEALQIRLDYPDGHWMLKERDSISSKEISEDREKIKALQCLPSINLRRNKFHAHFDKEYFTKPKEIQKDAPLIFNNLNEIEAVLTEIYNRYSSAFDGNVQDFKILNIFDVDEVLDILYEHREAMMKSLELKNQL